MDEMRQEAVVRLTSVGRLKPTDCVEKLLEYRGIVG